MLRDLNSHFPSNPSTTTRELKSFGKTIVAKTPFDVSNSNSLLISDG
jgi:hypothetical protein